MKFVVDKVNDDEQKRDRLYSKCTHTSMIKAVRRRKGVLEQCTEIIGSGSGLSKIASRPVQHDAIGFVKPSS